MREKYIFYLRIHHSYEQPQPENYSLGQFSTSHKSVGYCMGTGEAISPSPGFFADNLVSCICKCPKLSSPNDGLKNKY